MATSDFVTQYTVEEIKRGDEGYEPLLHDKSRRFTMFPIQYTDIWELYRELQSSYWLFHELDLTTDRRDFDRLKPEEQFYIKRILAFFAASDALVNLNIFENYQQEIVAPEALAFLALQSAQECVHTETYGQLILALVSDSQEQNELFQALTTDPIIKKKGEWALRHASEQTPFQKRLIAFACVEGILFASSFAGIAYLKHRKLGLFGLTTSNEFISRDESLHAKHACLLYRSHVLNKLPTEEAHAIIREAVDLEKEFVTHSIPSDLIGLSSGQMCTYVEFMANNLCIDLGLPKIYTTSTCPFEWIKLLTLKGQTNFFELRVSDYAHEACNSGGDLRFDMSF